MTSILGIIYDYIQSDNLDKLRIAGLLCLDKIIKNIYELNKKNINIFKENNEINLLSLKILFLLLNDEYSNIRKKASEIFMLFNSLSNVLSLNDSSLCYINDYLCQKILAKIDAKNEVYKQFEEYILDNNFYFRTNVFETKVFYYEPDNNYIDNSQNKMLVVKNILKNNFDINTGEEKKSDIANNKILAVFEEFTDRIKSICKNIIANKNNIDKNKDDLKYIYRNMIRPKIYLLNK